MRACSSPATCSKLLFLSWQGLVEISQHHCERSYFWGFHPYRSARVQCHLRHPLHACVKESLHASAGMRRVVLRGTACRKVGEARAGSQRRLLTTVQCTSTVVRCVEEKLLELPHLCVSCYKAAHHWHALQAEADFVFVSICRN